LFEDFSSSFAFFAASRDAFLEQRTQRRQDAKFLFEDLVFFLRVLRGFA
jgi:hypothetical protein